MQGENDQRNESLQEPDAYHKPNGYSWNIMDGSSNEHESAGDRKRIIFTAQERAFVMNLTTKYQVIKTKKADFATLAEKSKAWEDITRLFNAVPHHRKKTSKQLKKLWENINQIMKKKNNHEGCSDTTPVHFKDDSNTEHTVHGAMLSNECKMSDGIEDNNPRSDTNHVPPQMVSDISLPTQSDFIEVPLIDRIRFTENEKEFLYDQIAMCQDILDSKKCDIYSLAEKHSAWELITRTYNAVPSHSKKTNAQLKKWWENTKARRKQECAKINGEDGTVMRFKEEPTDFLLNFGGYSNGTEDTADSDVVPSHSEGIEEDHYRLATQYHDERTNGTDASSSKIKNSKRFTLSEKAFLAELIMTKYNDIIGESRHTERVSKEEKNKAWVEVTDAFNAVPHHSKRTRLQLIKLWRAMLHSRIGRGEAISLDERGTVLGQEDAAEFLVRLGLINKPLDDSNDEVIESNHHDLLEVEIEPSSIYDHPSHATRKRSASMETSPSRLERTQHEGNVRVELASSNVDNEREMHLLVVEEMKQRVALARLKVKAEEAEQKRVADAHTLEMAYKKQKWDLELKILRKQLNED